MNAVFANVYTLMIGGIMHTQDDKDFRYIKRRQMLASRQKYLGVMVEKLNKDPTFFEAMVNFSNHSNNHHFVERFSDRDLVINEVLPLYYKFILKHRKQIIEYCHMVPQPKRLELDVGGIRIGLSGLGTNLTFRTIYKKYEDRHESLNITNFLITDEVTEDEEND